MERDHVTAKQFLTATQLARELGVTAQTINNWRRNGTIAIAGTDPRSNMMVYDLEACRIAAQGRATRGGGRRAGAGRPPGTIEIDPVDGAPIKVVDGETIGRAASPVLPAAAIEAARENGEALFGDGVAGGIGGGSARRFKVDVTSPSTIAEMGREGVTAAEAKTAKDLLDAYARRIDLDERAGRLIDAAEARAMYLELVGTILQAIEALPGKIAREVSLIAGIGVTQATELREAIGRHVEDVRGVVRDAAQMHVESEVRSMNDGGVSDDGNATAA